jgi:hypothetical protein
MNDDMSFYLRVRGIMDEIICSVVIVPQLINHGHLDPLQPSVNGSAFVFDNTWILLIFQYFLASCSRIMPYLFTP